MHFDSGKSTTGGLSGRREYGRWQAPARKLLTPLFQRAWDIRVTGTANIPEAGPAILCANHNSVIDSFFLPLVVERRVTFLGKAEYLDDWKTRRLFPNLGMVPIDRRGGAAADQALHTAADLLAVGELVAIYPEGTRSRTGKLHKGRTGPARLALRTGAPIIPIGLRGTSAIQPPGRSVPVVGKRAEVHIGKPLAFGPDDGRGGDRRALRQIIDRVMIEIATLSGQDQSDEYAPHRAPERPVVESPQGVGRPWRAAAVAGDRRVALG